MKRRGMCIKKVNRVNFAFTLCLFDKKPLNHKDIAESKWINHG